MKSAQPIGIFDSGIGGLTLASHLTRMLPAEDLVYFGDTAHLPYGDKSTAAIQAYSVKISQFLLDKGVKAILIACNSASAAAYELVREYVGNKAKVFNVIDPVVDYLATGFPGRRVGLIGTKQTVNSGIFQQKLGARNCGTELASLATPLLAPMIEEGFFNNQISLSIIREYLENPILRDIEAIVLACTHYPLISGQINDFFRGKVAIIDSVKLVADRVIEELGSDGLLRPSDDEGKKIFYVSDFTPAFESATQLFFGGRLHLEHYPLWD